MNLREPLPEHLFGENYRIADPEIEFLGLTGRIEGSSLYLRGNDDEWESVHPSRIWGVPMQIREALATDIANGHGDHVGMILLPKMGGISLSFMGIIKPTDFRPERISEGDAYVGIKGVDIRLGQEIMKSSRSLELRIDANLDEGHIKTAFPDGTVIE